MRINGESSGVPLIAALVLDPSVSSFGSSHQSFCDTFHRYTGEGNDVQFKYLDFEAATEGEYWLIFRGFLLLHRDAAAGRFAAHRAAGIGSHVNRLELQSDFDEQNILHRDEFHEPVTTGLLEKAIVKARKMDTTYMQGFTLPGASPPPSDYFLGFRSPGTQVCDCYIDVLFSGTYNSGPNESYSHPLTITCRSGADFDKLASKPTVSTTWTRTAS